MRFYKLLISFFIITFNLFICSCSFGNRKSNENVSPQKAIINSDSVAKDSTNVSLAVVNSKVKTNSQKLHLNFSNYTENPVTTNSWYKLEKLSDTGEWKEIHLTNVIFPLVSYEIFPETTSDFDIFLYPDMIKYTPGKHKIWKEAIINGEKELISATFNME